ncbi:DUF6686 family protein [Dyadobacter tibetensis]|uniref:DUF6686 family protein n=1 Tax=Dyadobacter tibetensis TaxID=1211851 RepID=UPI0004B37649|nr:DUF6686 family protein [Dyadobacter tibetensis]
MMKSNRHTNSLRILGISSQGYIGQCACCDHYNFVYGNALFIFSYEGLRGFYQMLQESVSVYRLSEALPNGKDIVLPSPIPNFMLTFKESEIEDIKDMFQETFLTLEIDRIIA